MSVTNKKLTKQPRFKVEKVDTAEPLSSDNIVRLLDGKDGITLLVRAAKGEKKRGGYFFCIVRSENGMFALETMEQIHVADFTLDQLTRFINHTAGLRFDEEMLKYCQEKINFRTDAES